jgi:hypothetical protein
MAITVDNGDLTDFDVSVGAGAVDANTQRLTLASDDPAVASLADIKAAVEGPLTVASHAVTGPLTDAELRAVPVPVSGTVTANLSATDNAVLDAIAASVAGTLAVSGTVTANLSATDNAVLDAIAASVAGTLTVGSHAVTNAGTFVTQIDGAALTALQLIDDSIVADDGGFTAGTTKTTVAGFVADESSTDSVNEDDVGAARITLDRKQIIANYVHAAAGGATPHKNLDVDETEDDITTSPGKLYWLHAVNLSNAKRYLKFYNATAANTSVGTTVPVLTFPIPTFADTNGAGFTINFGDVGVQFSTAICVAATTGFADNDTGAPGNNEVLINCGYA